MREGIEDVRSNTGLERICFKKGMQEIRSRVQ